MERTIQFVNSSHDNVSVLWVHLHHEKVYFSLVPGQAVVQRTYEGHTWRCRCLNSNKLLGEFTAGPGDAVFEVHSKEPARCSTSPLRLDLLQPKPEWGAWRQRATAIPGIPIMAYDCVCERAVHIACHILERMLAQVQPEVLARLVGRGTRVGIIGKDQVTSDMPEHSYLKLSRGGRNIDTTARGLGGSIGCPLTTCGEENLIMVDDRSYPEENILVHEFGHAVMNVGLDDASRAAIQEAYQKAKASGIYLNSGCYAMENADEYWAEGTQAWFEATTRTDVNGGINTRLKIKERDPGLAALLSRTYGEGEWRFTHDSPAPLSQRSKRLKPCLSDGSIGSAGMPSPGTGWVPKMAGPAAAVDVADEALQPPTGMATDMVMERSRLVATSYASPTGNFCGGCFTPWSTLPCMPALRATTTCSVCCSRGTSPCHHHCPSSQAWVKDHQASFTPLGTSMLLSLCACSGRAPGSRIWSAFMGSWL